MGTEPLHVHSDSVQTLQVCSVGRGGARAAQWFQEDFEPSQEASQYGFSFCHDVFLCASTSDCVVSSIVLRVFLLDQYSGIYVLGGDPERQEREAGKTEATGNADILFQHHVTVALSYAACCPEVLVSTSLS